MKLTKDDIQFIDTYLKNSMIVYGDIRMEMVDHVATEIENKMSQGDKRPFQHIFKEYMALHRLRLLDSNSRRISHLTKQLAKKGFNKVLKVNYGIGFLCALAFYTISMEMFDLTRTVWVHLILNLSPILGLNLIYEYKRRKNKAPRISGIERLGVIISLLVLLVFLIFNLSSSYTEWLQFVYVFVFSAQLIITTAFLSLGIEQYKMYKNKFRLS